jgi:hypothetical protein
MRGAVAPTRIDAAPGGTWLGADTALHHDCARCEVTLALAAPDGCEDRKLTLDTGDFDGSYLSLAFTLPRAFARGLGAEHVVAVETTSHADRPLLARLNIAPGPNVARDVQDMAARGTAFDLFYVPFDAARATKLWVDVFVTDPARSHVALTDLRVTRYRRAPL